jgi:hypothetical protein
MPSEFDIYVPLTNQAGKKHRPSLIAKYRQRIIDEFGGVTDFRHRMSGVWRMGAMEIHDDVLLWRVLTARTPHSRKVLHVLKGQMEKELKQTTVLIVERQVRVLR